MNIQDEELNYKTDTYFNLFGQKVDYLTTVVNVFGICLGIFIWLYFGLYNKGYNKYFLYALCLFLVSQTFTSGISIASYSVEDNEIKEVVQLNAVLFSSLTILFAFGNSNFDSEDNKMLIISLFVSLLAVVYYSIKKSGDGKRTIRKLKILFMTISIFIFMNFLFNVAVKKFNLLGN